MEQKPTLNFEIEAATPADLDEATEMRLQSWLDSYVNDELGVTAEWIESRNRLQMTAEKRQARLERLQEPDTAFYVARDSNGNIIGATSPYISSDGKQHVGSLYVDKLWHGKGVGGALMQKVIDFFDPAKPIELGVVAYNERAKAFYRKWGFEEVSGSESVFADRVPEIQMIRNTK